MRWLGIILMAALLAVAPGSASAEPPAPKGVSPGTQPQGLEAKGEQAPAVKNYTPQERQAYEKKIARDLTDIQDGINGLQVKSR